MRTYDDENCGGPYGAIAGAVVMLTMALLYIWFGS